MKPRRAGELVGVVSKADYGCRDVGYPVLSFEVEMDNGFSVLQIFDGEQADDIIRETGVYSVRDLNGRVCYMQKTGPSTSRFSRWAA